MTHAEQTELDAAIENLKFIQSKMPANFDAGVQDLIANGLECTELKDIRHIYNALWELADPDTETGEFLGDMDLSYASYTSPL